MPRPRPASPGRFPRWPRSLTHRLMKHRLMKPRPMTHRPMTHRLTRCLTSRPLRPCPPPATRRNR